jgi:hypothetical protein
MFYFIGGDSRALSSNFFKPLNHICAIFEPYKPAILLFLKLAYKDGISSKPSWTFCSSTCIKKKISSIQSTPKTVINEFQSVRNPNGHYSMGAPPTNRHLE